MDTSDCQSTKKEHNTSCYYDSVPRHTHTHTGPTSYVPDFLTRSAILADMEKIFQAAMAAESFATAVRAKELLGKEIGLFKGGTPSLVQQLLSLDANEISAFQAELIKAFGLEDTEGDVLSHEKI